MKFKCPIELERWTKLKKNISNNLENLIAYTTGKWTGLLDILLSWDFYLLFLNSMIIDAYNNDSKVLKFMITYSKLFLKGSVKNK